MPWTCPKCGLHVGHDEAKQPMPEEGTVYHCPVCHLALKFDPVMQKMKPVKPTDWPTQKRTA